MGLSGKAVRFYGWVFNPPPPLSFWATDIPPREQRMRKQSVFHTQLCNSHNRIPAQRASAVPITVQILTKAGSEAAFKYPLVIQWARGLTAMMNVPSEAKKTIAQRERSCHESHSANPLLGHLISCQATITPFHVTPLLGPQVSRAY